MESKLEKAQQEVDSFSAAFPSLALMENSKEEKDEIEVFYLWDTLSDFFQVFKILVNYLSENYGMDSSILLALIKEKNLPLERTLQLVPYIHSGYLDIIVERNDGDRD